MAGQVVGHEVHVVGQVLPRAGAGNLGLAAELAFGADFARHARHFARKRVQLVHHRVDRVLQLEDFALHVHRDLARQIAAGDRRRHFGDVADLSCQISRHRVHRVGQIFPRAGHAWHVGLPAQPALAAHFACHARHFAGEPVQLVHHGVESFLELQNFSAHVHGNFSRKVPARNSRGHFGNISDLSSEVAGHEVHVVRQVFPRPRDSGHLSLAAELALRAHFARHARYFARERVELVHHGVDRVFEFENFSLHVHRNFARQIAAGHGCGDFSDVAHLRREVPGHGVHRIGQVLPCAGHAGHHGLPSQPAFRAHFARHARHFRGKGPQLVHHRVDGLFELQNFAANIDGDLAGKVAARNGRRHLRNVAHLTGQVAGHRIDGVGQILPRARHAGYLRLPAEFAVGPDFTGHARNLSGENAKLLDHRVGNIGRPQELPFQRSPIHVQAHNLG